MSISLAQQKGSTVYVYDDNNRQLFAISGDLQGYTSGSVTIKKGYTLYTYDERGRQISAHSC